VKLGATMARQAEMAPQFEENRYSGTPEVRWRPVEQPAEPEPSSPPQPTQPYQVNYMENQHDNQQPGAPQLPQAPDPTQYDFYEPTELARFQHDTTMYMQSQIDARVQAHLAPHAESLRDIELRRDYNACVDKYGGDENFQDVMKVALENCAEAQARGKQFSIIAAYQAANDKTAARPGQRGNAHLPESLRSGRNAIGNLGKIMFHNSQVGRSRR
jgi:hypothetical protein